jgi:hypothetical protein
VATPCPDLQQNPRTKLTEAPPFLAKASPASSVFRANLNQSNKSSLTKGDSMKKTVEFEAHKKVKKEQEVVFKTKTGKKVDFMAKKDVKEPVHVKFKAKRD